MQAHRDLLRSGARGAQDGGHGDQAGGEMATIDHVILPLVLFVGLASVVG
jgi:hypothetical protein